MEDILNYIRWNSWLWQYFFPNENENAILYIDDNLISSIGIRHGINEENTIQDFLASTLLTPERINNFSRHWQNFTGLNENCPAQNWGRLVMFLQSKKLPKDVINLNGPKIPASFAMLCAIMYLACTTEAQHRPMKDAAAPFLGNEYIGSNYTGRVGELADGLFATLHDRIPEFDADRMICLQRHIGRIKYHMVLTPQLKDDFIDFLEVNNLSWGYEQYSSYVNDRLIPALNKANKQKFIELVTQEEYIPYFKNILQSGLQFGREAHQNGNERQPIDILWKYELYFDYDGVPSFYITSDTPYPFSIELADGHFVCNDDMKNNEYIAADTIFSQYADQEFNHNNIRYFFKNIASTDGNWEQDIYFEKIAEDSYRQICNPVPGKEYIRICPVNRNIRGNWEISTLPLELAGYTIYKTDNYIAPVRRNTQLQRINDQFNMVGVGTYFSIQLNENQILYWKPDALGNDQIQPLNTERRANGKSYFRLPSTNGRLSGKLFVSHTNGRTYDMSERIFHESEWDGSTSMFHMNGWGEVSKNNNEDHPRNLRTHARLLIQNVLAAPSEGSVRLIQILHEIADTNGCISQQKLVSALNFVLEYFNIIPTKPNRKSLIYALRRLGYIIAFYDPNTSEYINQLNAPYLELTNYSITNIRNAYLVKGIYSLDCLETIQQNAGQNVKYLRPYDEDTLNLNPEYICLPDLILLETDNTNGWNTQQYPVAEQIIGLMENIGSFPNHFNINQNGNVYPTPNEFATPCTIKDLHGNEMLCTRRDNQYLVHNTYFNEGHYRPIPKHLARAYCQYIHEQPVCIMTNTPNNGINYATITFLHGMAKPELLDMALCDLNLGLPHFNFFFVVDNENSNLPRSTSYVQGKTYSTVATSDNHELLTNALEKTAARSINNYSDSNSVFLARRPMALHWKMKLLKNKNNYKHSLILNNNQETIAFSIGTHHVYCKRPNGEFIEVEGNSVNGKLSSIINNTQNFTQIIYDGEIPNYNDDNGKEVKILIRNV